MFDIGKILNFDSLMDEKQHTVLIWVSQIGSEIKNLFNVY